MSKKTKGNGEGRKTKDDEFVLVEGKRKRKKKRRKKEKAVAAGTKGAKGPGQDGTSNGPATEQTTASNEAKQRKR